MSTFYNLLSFLPIVLLMVVSIWKGVKAGIYTGFAATAVLFFIWGSKFTSFLASVFSAFVGTINILMIIFGAVFLYQTMEQKGYILGIKESLSQIHPDTSFRFFFLAFFLTAFFESIAGFGTPGAIVPLILISMGFAPVLSISVVLLIDGLFALTGAVGTPVIAGLETPLQLNPATVSTIYLYSTAAIFMSGLVITFFIYRFLERASGSSAGMVGWLLYGIIMIPFLLTSYFLRELTGLIASIFMAVFSYIFLFKNKQLQWKPWTPYGLLVLLLLLPKIIPGIVPLLAYKVEFLSILGTDISASLQPFKSPLIPFLAASAFALYYVKDFTIDLKPVVSKSFSVFLVLFPSLAITQLMLNSGNGTPSIIEMLADVFVKTGDAYPIFSPLIGVLGAFVSGSTTVSNIIFGSVQYASAINLAIQPEIFLSLQLAGASLGNAVCLFNIIAAAAVVGTDNYSEILKKNLLPVLLASLTCSLAGYLLILFFN